MRTELTAEQVVNYTNRRLKAWYKDAKKEYGIVGEAKASYNDKTGAIEIRTKEDGYELGKLTVKYWQNMDIAFCFDVWSENPVD